MLQKSVIKYWDNIQIIFMSTIIWVSNCGRNGVKGFLGLILAFCPPGLCLPSFQLVCERENDKGHTEYLRIAQNTNVKVLWNSY